MKTIQLEGEALETAKKILEVSEGHSKLSNAWHEKVHRESNAMQKAAEAEVNVHYDNLTRLAGIDPEKSKPQLDLRYLKVHGIAFLVLPEDDGDDELDGDEGAADEPTHEAAAANQ